MNYRFFALLGLIDGVVPLCIANFRPLIAFVFYWSWFENINDL